MQFQRTSVDDDGFIKRTAKNIFDAAQFFHRSARFRIEQMGCTRFPPAENQLLKIKVQNTLNRLQIFSAPNLFSIRQRITSDSIHIIATNKTRLIVAAQRDASSKAGTFVPHGKFSNLCNINQVKQTSNALNIELRAFIAYGQGKFSGGTECDVMFGNGWHLNFLHRGFAEQSGGFEQQNQNQNREGDAIAVVRHAGNAARESFQQAQNQSANRRARQVADAAQHGGEERLQGGLHAHGGVNARVVHREQNAARACERGAEAEGERDDGVDVHTHERGGGFVEGDGAHGGSHPGFLHDEPQRHKQQRGGHEDDHLVHADDEAAEIPSRGWNEIGEFMRRGAENVAVLAGVFDEQRNADGGDEDGELGPAAQRTIGEIFDDDAQQRADGHRQNKDERATDIRLRGQKFIHHRRQIISRERAEHENIAVREVDEAQDAINHRVAERDERINRAQRKTID